MKNPAAAPNGPTAEEQQNLQIIRRHVEKWADGDFEAIAEDFAQDTRNHGVAIGRAGIRVVIEDIWRTFPDWRGEILEILAARDSVVVRLNASGTHLGTGRFEVNGGMLAGVEPTGKRFTAQHIHWYKLRDGRIVEHVACRDDLGMMQQLGLLPARGVSQPEHFIELNP